MGGVAYLLVLLEIGFEGNYGFVRLLSRFCESGKVYYSWNWGRFYFILVFSLVEFLIIVLGMLVRSSKGVGG